MKYIEKRVSSRDQVLSDKKDYLAKLIGQAAEAGLEIGRIDGRLEEVRWTEDSINGDRITMFSYSQPSIWVRIWRRLTQW